MIVATAGHVDHGKTALVEALTGVDTDRTAEEKRRGLTIDLGFAYMDGPDGSRIGFVDVPGHERFIRNMLAGIAAVDQVLLVVAADDGPMPQTREHLAILELLGLHAGMVALTKSDRVPRDRLQQAREELAALLARSPLAAAPVFAVSAVTGEGMEALRSHLHASARETPHRDSTGHFRLAVDRSFTVEGAGLVVTGSVYSGLTAVGESLTVLPSGQTARVRGIHTQGRSRETATAGDRAALNLAGAGLDRGGVERGHWLVAPDIRLLSARVDSSLALLPGARTLRHWTPVHLHLAADNITGRVALLRGRTLAAGASDLVQLVLDRPVHALFGDRFIIRDQSARETLGGGRVIDPLAPGRRRRRPERLARLHALSHTDPGAALSALLAASPNGVSLDEFARTRNLTATHCNALATAIDCRRVPDSGDTRLVTARAWEALQQAILDAVEDHHRSVPDSLGLDETRLARTLGRDMPQSLLRAAARELLECGALARSGFCLHRPGHQPRLRTEDRALLGRVEEVLDPAGLKPPIIGDLAAALELDREDLRSRLEHLAGLGYLVRVAPNRYFLPATVDALAGIARELARESADGRFDAASYRDRSGIGRNLTVQVLEHLDRLGITWFRGGRRGIRE